MESRNLTIWIVLPFQSALGILGNFSLLFYCLFLYYNEGTLKTIYLILTHVFTVNSLIILSKGMLQITGAFEWTQFFSDVGCKVILYILRPGRSMSISTTCLLSVFQAITISPRSACWKDLMVKTLRFMGVSSLLDTTHVDEYDFPCVSIHQEVQQKYNKKKVFNSVPPLQDVIL